MRLAPLAASRVLRGRASGQPLALRSRSRQPTDTSGWCAHRGHSGQVRDQVRLTGHARAAARSVAIILGGHDPHHVDGRGEFRRWGASTGLAGIRVFELSRFAGVAPLGGLFDKASHARTRSQARGSLGRLANLQMEPTRPTVCAIMSLRRAAHLARWAGSASASIEHQYA